MEEEGEAMVLKALNEVDLAGRRVVSVDPGSRDIVTCLSYDKDGS